MIDDFTLRSYRHKKNSIINYFIAPYIRISRLESLAPLYSNLKVTFIGAKFINVEKISIIRRRNALRKLK